MSCFTLSGTHPARTTAGRTPRSYSSTASACTTLSGGVSEGFRSCPQIQSMKDRMICTMASELDPAPPPLLVDTPKLSSSSSSPADAAPIDLFGRAATIDASASAASSCASE